MGCGTGAVALAAAASLGGGAVVTATDRESRSLALATANAARNGLEVRLSPLDYATDEAVAAFAARHGVTAPSPSTVECNTPLHNMTSGTPPSISLPAPR